MKIVCGSCQAKYSIADEKVAGKVFKIRCKRCSEVIVVRGDQEEPEAAASHSHEEPSADAIWHVVLNGEQAGPYAPAQLADMINAGSLDWEAYVWTEGFENWLPMRDVPELVTAISGPPESEPQQQAQPEPVRAAVGAPVYTAAQPSMGADPFADEGGGGGGVFASPAMAAQPAARPNLFVARDESPFEAENRVVASAPSPRVSMEQAMTGARNENSVLFSLKNLQALATGSSAPGPGGAPSAPPQRPGFAGGEGSGLIDIRALASATGVNDQGRGSEKDALLSLGSAQAGAFGALGSPMLAPPTRDEDSGKKGLVFAIVGGFALLAVAGVGAAVILKPAPAAPAVVAPVAPPPVAAVAPPQPVQQPAEAPSEGELNAQRRQQQQQQQQANAAPAAPSGESHRAPAAGSKRPEKPEPAAAAKPEPAAPKPEPAAKPKGGSSSIDDLLDSAIGAKGGGAKAGGSTSAAAAASTANLPDKPSRDDVLNAMNSIKAPIAACANGQTGVAFANITVSGKTGKVSNVEVTGMTGEVGSCIARTVRKASFPKFKSDSFQIKFPFRL